MKRSGVIAGVVVCTVLALLAGGVLLVRSMKNGGESGPPGGGGPPPETVTIVPVGTREWRKEYKLVGTVIAKQNVTLGAEVSGTVREVLFDSGSVVEQGQVLVRLDATTELAELDTAKAEVSVAEATLRASIASRDLAETRVKRWSQAMAVNAATALDLDTAKGELDVAIANAERATSAIASAKARLAEAQAAVAKKELAAPFRAIVGLRNVHPGQYLSEGQAIVGLQSVDENIFLDFAIPQEHLDKVVVGAVFQSKSDIAIGGQLPIKVVAIDAAANYDTRNIRVRSEVPNPDGRLRTGMFIDVEVPIAPFTTFLAVPMTAVRRAAYGDHVFVIEPGEGGMMKAKQRFVKLGPSMDGEVIVLEGLKQGERVATSGSFKLNDGSTVIEGGAPSGGVQAARQQ